MSVVVNINDKECKVENGHWTCPSDQLFEDQLREHCEFFIENYFSPGSDPHPDLTSATYMVEEFDGRIVKDDGPPKQVLLPDVVY